MREMFHSHLGKLVGNTKNLLTCLSAEKTTESKETSQASPKSSATTSQEKTDHPAGQPTEKSKKRRIPFVAFALVVVFTSLCAFSLLRPDALAKTMLFSDTNPTATVAPPKAVTVDQSVSQMKSMGAPVLGSGVSCGSGNAGFLFKTAVIAENTDPNYKDHGNLLCWNQTDFWWGNRDITCVYNDSHGAGSGYTLNFHNGSFNINNIGGVNGDGTSTGYLNQNSCLANSTCVSDNRSNSDQNKDSSGNTTIHSQVGGDDILCGNNSCTNVNVGGNTNDCGGSAGQGLAYNRFGCKMMDSGTQFVGRNWNDPNSNDQSKQFFGGTLDWNWHSTGIAINPTAFDPTGALYLPTYNLRAIDINPTQDTPTCPNNKEWTCPNNENIVLYQYQGNFSKNNDGLYEQALPSTSNAPQQTAKKDISKVSGNGGIDGYTPGGQPIPLFWVACDAMGAGWAFPCSDKAGQDGEMPGVNFNVGQSLDEDTVSESIIVKDWLSGDSNPKADSDPNVPAEQQSGHLLHTYLQDTILQPKVHQLYGLTLGLGYVLISPIIVLLGYQMLWASWTFRYAGLMDTIPRLILSMVTVGISYDMASTLIGLTNLFNSAIITLHISIPYSPIQINGQDYTFTLAHQGETDAASFRAIVVPISRWGCIANDFVSLLAQKFWTDIQQYVPMIGGMLKFAENIPNMIDFAKHIGEFLMLIMSVMLCVQAFVRIILLNYYILVGPVVFACWGLPGGMGNNVVRQWAKGFASLLFVQTVQLFVLTTLPLIMPTFPTLPTDTFGLINVLLGQLPRVIVVVAAVQVPKMMGTQATRAIAQAGTVAGGAVAAAGAAAYQTV